jgi:hypothetical protein
MRPDATHGIPGPRSSPPSAPAAAGTPATEHDDPSRTRPSGTLSVARSSYRLNLAVLTTGSGQTCTWRLLGQVGAPPRPLVTRLVSSFEHGPRPDRLWNRPRRWPDDPGMQVWPGSGVGPAASPTAGPPTSPATHDPNHRVWIRAPIRWKTDPPCGQGCGQGRVPRCMDRDLVVDDPGLPGTYPAGQARSSTVRPGSHPHGSSRTPQRTPHHPPPPGARSARHRPHAPHHDGDDDEVRR